MTYRDGCPVCFTPQQRWRELRRYHHARLTRCRGCGHVFAATAPSAAELEQHYGGYPRTPCTSSITLRRYDELLDSFAPRRRLGRLLDVGCGVGDFLLAARTRGWEVHGVELESRAREICRERGLEVLEAPLDPTRYAPASFDVITSFEVLEHMTTPRAEIAALAGLLREGGLLYVTTPNFASLTRRLLGPRYEVICYPEHLGYFTYSTLDRLMRTSGLRRVELLSTGVSPGRIAAGLRRGARTNARSVDDSVRAMLERDGAPQRLKAAVNRGLSRLALGDTLKASYERA